MSTKYSNKYRNLRNEIGDDYHTLCRLCLSKTSSKLHVKFEEGQNRDIQGKMLKFLSLIVTEDDSLPKFVCYSCIDKLDDFQEFRDMCYESENLLKEYILSADDKSGKGMSDYEKSSASSSHGSEETVAAPVSDMGFPSSELFIKCETETAEDPLVCEQTSLQDLWPPDQLNVKTETTSFLVPPDVDSSFDSKLSNQNMEETAVASVESSLHFEGAAEEIHQSGQNVSGSEEFYQCKSEQFDEIVPAMDNDTNVVILSDKDMKNSVSNPDQAEGEVADPGERHQNEMEVLLEVKDISRSDRHFPLSSDIFKQVSLQEQPNINSECVNEQEILEPEPSTKSFESKTENIRSARSNNKKKQLECSLCKKCFSSVALLITHRRIHKNKIPFICSICRKSFSQEGSRNVHMRIHTKEKPFDCSICNKSFRQKEHLHQHMRIHTKEKPFDCSICKKVFRRKQDLKQHIKNHNKVKPFRCSICNEGFSRKRILHEHMSIHTNEKPFHCSVCNKSFRTIRDLKQHVIIHNNEKPFHCSICNKGFSEKWNLHEHTRIHTIEKPFDCTICNKSFRTIRDRKQHVIIHNNEKAFHCSICNKGFSEKWNLREHTRIHTIEKPFDCTICNKGFRTIRDLEQHVRIHNKVKPFHCSICNKGFSRKSILHEHMKIHTKEKPFHL